MKHQPLAPHEIDQNIASWREWVRELQMTTSGQLQLGRIMAMSYKTGKGQYCKSMTEQDLSDIAWMGYCFLELLVSNAKEVDAMNAEGGN